MDELFDMMIDPQRGSYPAPIGRYRSTGKHEILFVISDLKCTIKRIYWKERMY